MTLTAKHLQDVCLLGSQNKSRTCRYLRNDELDESKWYCQKLQQHIKAKIDKNIASIIERSNSSLYVNMPFGDNCAGYPLFKHIPQGYDVNS